MALMKNSALLAIAMSVMITNVTAAPAVNESLPGQALTDFGKKFNIAHLQLTGEVINHLAHDLRVEMAEICRLHPCSLWTTWSKCKYNEPGRYRQYGASNRSRNCGFNTTLCKRYGDRNMEHEHRICKCKEGFTVTKHGYCLKYFSTRTDHGKAQAACHKEGGYLANSGSAKKFDDINAMNRSYPTNSFWVDGYKKSSASKWMFENQPEDSSFNKWYTTKSSSIGCKGHVCVRGKWYFNGLSCTERHSYMCEILA